VYWHRDDRRASLYTRLYVAGMRLRRDKQAFEGAEQTRRTALQRQRGGDAPPTLLTRLRFRITSTTQGGMTVWRVRPRRRRPAVRVVYVHGGGYVHPLTPDYWRLVRSLAKAPAEVVVPAYPLAPEHHVDEVLPALVDLAEPSGTDVPTVLMGDSAGGALVLAIAMHLRDAGGPQPAGVVALSPWLNPRLDEPEVEELESTDPMLAETGLRAAGQWWAGTRSPTDPDVDPLRGRLDGLPPTRVFIGDRDILRPAVDELAGRAEGSDVALTVHEVTAMFHVWMTRAIPEGRRTRRRLQRLIAST